MNSDKNRVFPASGARRPFWAILVVSLIAVMVNCYPVLFCGRSYVSPVQGGMAMVYDWWPALPGMPASSPMLSSHGSDVAATLIWAVPVGFIESRSLREHGELPLWNRYSHAGDTLIGQAVSMMGDPLQMIVIAGNGSALAWDIKFLAAKLLFCVGFGWLIFRLCGNGGLSLIYTALAAYCGAFFYINNHPAFFVFSYAPWILLSALGLLDLQSPHPWRWGLVWLAVNFACFNAGHVEVAVVLIGGLNAAALAFAMARHGRGSDHGKILARIGVGTLLFLGLTAPVWMSFLTTLEGSYSVHAGVRVDQLRWISLAGVFDDVFYLILMDPGQPAIAPGTSLLVMTGCILSAVRWRQLQGDRFFWINSGAILLWTACVFGIVPAVILEKVPLLNRVGHLYTDFSYLVVIHLTIQSAYGFRCLVGEENLRRTAIDFLWIGLVFAGIVFLYSFELRERTVTVPWGYFLSVTAGAFGAPLLFVFLNRSDRPVSMAGWLGIVLLGFIPQFRFGFYHSGNNTLLMLPGPRPVLNAPSAAIQKIKADPDGPFRVVALRWNLYGDYAAVYELEDIRSCAPLSNGDCFELLQKFPGMDLSGGMLAVTNPVMARPLLNLLNVKYLLAQPGFRPSGPGLRLVDQLDFGIIENAGVWPRAFFSDKIVRLSTRDEFTRYLVENGERPFVAVSAAAILEQPGLHALEITNQTGVSPASHYRLLPNSTAFDVHASSAGIVCLTEGQGKDFIARVNNETRPVLTVNRAFKGVYLDRPGDYHLEFIYRPRHWLGACILFWIALAGVTGLVGGNIFCRKKKAGQLAGDDRQ